MRDNPNPGKVVHGITINEQSLFGVFMNTREYTAVSHSSFKSVNTSPSIETVLRPPGGQHILHVAESHAPR